MIFTYFLFFLCCWFGSKAHQDNVQFNLVLPYLFTSLQTNKKWEKPKNIQFWTNIWWGTCLLYKNQKNLITPKCMPHGTLIDKLAFWPAGPPPLKNEQGLNTTLLDNLYRFYGHQHRTWTYLISYFQKKYQVYKMQTSWARGNSCTNWNKVPILPKRKTT